MDAPSNINDEISSLSRQIEQEEGAIEAVERLAQNASPKNWSTSRNKVRHLEKKLKNLQLIRDAPDWVVVFAQEQNDHDENWKH
ncbi:hypothetical protein TSTA_001960 [Talaromyces stipitatus ATCC 10500]|uniref:Uncharacterized protein n=1 Tax=Talaromyces stipitatus (strain ATCC 10500 / CBS 375.48 / QM 6759 / NRRL 1006) TaxID=441959 RepID=B8MS70_TALSN|nr:uncharacterized protein TSTA_001960 [Talaromyces stipitatus ATCC 10500]EED12128.1 hypothetical protein TSTA_001960 [Talaromyces stipitatus ATCC 10500]